MKDYFSVGTLVAVFLVSLALQAAEPVEDYARLGSFINKVEAQAKEFKIQLEKLNQEKGHDKSIYEVLVTADKTLERIENNLKALQPLKSLPRDIYNDLKSLEGQVGALQKMVPKKPTDFPMACGNPKITNTLETHKGIVEYSNNKWVFSRGDEKAIGSLRTIHISDNAGLLGSTVSDPVVKTQTTKDHYVEALVDAKGNEGKGLVMCLSKEMKVQ